VVGAYFCIGYTFTFGSEIISNLSLSACPGVKSGLPPFSYAISSWEPQRLVWQLALIAHIPPRVIIVLTCPQIWLPGAGRVWLYSGCIIEVFSLVLLTVFHVDSILGFHAHAAFFATWAIGAFISMGITLHLSRLTGMKDRNSMFHSFFVIKCCLFVLFALAVLGVTIFYPISQRLCLTWAFSIFCVCEYSIVGLNVGFYAFCLHEISTAFAGFRISCVPHGEEEKTQVEN
ncbi:hypothetical protein PFISCL1PPCAC_14100, partial [Pristionchus fissidentatus]